MGIYYYYNTAVLELGISKSAYKIYHLLAASAKNKDRSSYKSKETMAKEVGLSVSTVYRALKELKNVGLLKIKKQYRAKGEQSTNLYILTDAPNAQMEIVPKKTDYGKMRQLDRDVYGSNLSGTMMKIYCLLKSGADKQGFCHAYLRDIAGKLKTSIRTVQRYVRELRQKGFLSVFRSNGGKSTYQVKNAPKGALTQRKAQRNHTIENNQKTREQCALLEAETQQFLAELTDEHIPTTKLTSPHDKIDLLTNLL